MMREQLMLLDFSDTDNEMIKKLATEAVARGDYSGDWDHAYESLWESYEHYPEDFEDLK